jgi:hypothetical protein
MGTGKNRPPGIVVLDIRYCFPAEIAPKIALSVSV